jgi:general stress protein 26
LSPPGEDGYDRYMAHVPSFEAIAEEFARRVQRIIWCTMATADAERHIRSRIVHPLWDGKRGWVLTNRHSPKGKEVDGNPWASLTYIDNAQEQVHVDCATAWEERLAEKRRLWDWFKATPPPLGYDPGLFFTKGVEDGSFGALRLDSWRIELWSLADLMSGKPAQVWKA